MVKYTDAQGNTTNLNREEFMALMKALYDAAHSTDDKEVDPNG